MDLLLKVVPGFLWLLVFRLGVPIEAQGTSAAGCVCQSTDALRLTSRLSCNFTAWDVQLHDIDMAKCSLALCSGGWNTSFTTCVASVQLSTVSLPFDVFLAYFVHKPKRPGPLICECGAAAASCGARWWW